MRLLPRVFPLALLLGLSGTSVYAQGSAPPVSSDARLAMIHDNATRAIVSNQLAIAQSHGLPAGPLMAKALEGVAKKASPRRIGDAMAALERRMGRARELLAPSSTVEELAAGADALLIGVPDQLLRQMRLVAPKRSIVLELGVVTELVAKNVPPAQASRMVLELMARGASGAQLTALSGAVQSDVLAGLKPEVALDLRGRGVLSLLSPNASLSSSAFGTDLLSPKPKK